MARVLIREAHGGATRIINDRALPYFPGWVILDTLDDSTDSPPQYLSKAQADLWYTKKGDAATGGITLGAAPMIVKPNGNGLAGMLDWEHDDASGYLTHFRAGPNTTINSYMYAAGTDEGLGGGVLVSHKNGGNGYRLIQHPGSGLGFYSTGQSTNPYRYTDIYAGSGGELIALKTGAGFADGGLTAGSKVLTSATAAFTSADVGASVTKTLFEETALPSGATIASVESATSVTLSVAATGTRTTLKFIVGGRAPASSQKIQRVVDTDGSTIISQLLKGSAILAVPLIARDAATLGLEVRSTTAQTADIFKARNVDLAVDALRVKSDGSMVAQMSAQVTNAGKFDLANVEVLRVRNYTALGSVPALTIWNSETSDGLRINNADGSAIRSRFNKGGYFMTRLTAAPADADLVNGEAAIYVDATAGASALKVKIKDSAGAVTIKTLAA